MSARMTLAQAIASGSMFRSTAQECADDADEIIAALSAAGYEIVPREPTEAMLNAPLGKSHAHGVLRETRVDLRPSIWRAMLAAANPKEQGQ